MMGTGNFNITLAQEQNPEMDFGVALLPGVESGQVASFAGGDIVTIPKGSKRVDDAVDFMKFLLSDEVQVEVYAKMLNMTTRGDMADNKYFQAEPKVQDVAKAIDVGRTPYTLKFFELINSPQGPWLQMLQRAYYEDTDLDTDHLRRPGADEGDRRRVTPARRRSGRRRGLPRREQRNAERRRRRLTGLLYLAPALAFVLAFTAWPFAQMVFMSLHNWSLIAERKFIGTANFVRAWNDPQFWVSLGFTLKYTLYITPILMGLGFLIALLVAEDTPHRAPDPRRRLRAGRHRPRRLEPALVLALQLRPRARQPGARRPRRSSPSPCSGSAPTPTPRSGRSSSRSSGRCSASACSSSSPRSTPSPPRCRTRPRSTAPATGARARHITLPLTARTILLVTLVSAIGSLLAFDQFYIMTAGQPRNMTATSVFLIYLNSFPYLKLGYGAALSLILSLIILVLHGGADR